MNPFTAFVNWALAVHPQQYCGYLVVTVLLMYALVGILILFLIRDGEKRRDWFMLICAIFLMVVWMVLVLLQALLLAHPAFPGVFW